MTGNTELVSSGRAGRFGKIKFGKRPVEMSKLHMTCAGHVPFSTAGLFHLATRKHRCGVNHILHRHKEEKDNKDILELNQENLQVCLTRK